MRARRRERVLVRRLTDECVAVVPGRDAFVLQGDLLAVFEAADGQTSLEQATGLSADACATAVGQLAAAGLVEPVGVSSRRTVLLGAAGVALAVPLVGIPFPQAAAAVSVTLPPDPGPTGGPVTYTPALTVTVSSMSCGVASSNNPCPLNQAELTVVGSGYPPVTDVQFTSPDSGINAQPTTTDVNGAFTTVIQAVHCTGATTWSIQGTTTTPASSAFGDAPDTC